MEECGKERCYVLIIIFLFLYVNDSGWEINGDFIKNFVIALFAFMGALCILGAICGGLEGGGSHNTYIELDGQTHFVEYNTPNGVRGYEVVNVQPV